MDAISMCSDSEPPKKKRIRAKLDHLTPSEKLQRRKMKNRIAAQTARDRKRAKIDHLEAENRKLRLENELLKSKLMNTSAMSLEATRNSSSRQPIDSGISGTDSVGSPVKADEQNSSNHLVVDSACFPHSPGSSTSGVYSSSPLPESTTEHFETMVEACDEEQLIDDILQLHSSLYCESGTDTPIESAELINVPQQKVQVVSYQSQSVENSAGWTSIQLMLLLMISKVHRFYWQRTNCCARTPDEWKNNIYCSSNDLYDYILQTKCMDFRRATEAIISNKSNIYKQRVAALQFVNKYVNHSLLVSDHLLIQSY